MAGSWRLLCLVRAILIACGLHTYQSSGQPGATVHCSHGGFDRQNGAAARVYSHGGDRSNNNNINKNNDSLQHAKDVEVAFRQDFGEMNVVPSLARLRQKSVPDSDTGGHEVVHEASPGWVSRRMMAQQQEAQDIVIIGQPVPAPVPAQPPPLPPTPKASPAPTLAPSQVPTRAPTQAPKLAPTQAPIQAPILAPIRSPTPAPTQGPTAANSTTRAPSPTDSPPINATSPVPSLFTPTPSPASLPGPSALELEREAILYFKGELTSDPTGVFKLWNDTNNPNPCNWYGIQCGWGGEDFGRVISLALPNRRLEGVLTWRIVNLPFLKVLDLSGNLISGALPLELGSLLRLQVLRLGGNTFRGPFPNLEQLVLLEEVDVSGCGMADAFPAMVRNFTGLSVLHLGENAFSGPIPIWLGWLPRLKFLHLGGNEFSGDVPNSLLNCTSLQFLNISANYLTGSVDSMVGNLVQLNTHLDMSQNRFSGMIPLSIGNLRELQGLNLSGNAFTGTVPQSIGNCTKLMSLDLSDNQLSGNLPESLSLLRSLQYELDFSRNEIEGLIPSGVSDLQNLTRMDLSFNKLTGEIPESIANMTSLVFFNVSMNALTGEVPDVGLFSTLLPASFLGNPGLCGRVVGKRCPWDVISGPVVGSGGGHKRGPTLITIIGAAAEGIVLVLFAVLLIRYLVQRRRPVPEKNVVLFSKYFKALKLTAEEIQAATNSTEHVNISGGAFSRTLSGSLRRDRAEMSRIEKAVLPDGTVFAVKQWCIARFKKKDRHKLDSEMVNFSAIRHRNVVRLMGYYMTPNNLAMLMEFCPSGSLDSHLHPPGQQTCQLNWNERLRIIMGVTTGLVYLHHETCGNAVVHCDLKAGNVLLDSDMEPKLVDFGMARLIKRNSKGATAASWVGSSGYAPPEYGFASECTKAGDVYSYGVLLLELITGKRPTSEEVASGMTLPVWVQSLRSQDRERYAVDMSLFQSADEPQLNQILHILNAALLCTGHVPATRPTMMQVLGNLQEMPETVTEEELVPVEASPIVDNSSMDFDN